MTDKPITEDPQALAEYLVRLAMEACAPHLQPGTQHYYVVESKVRVRMNNAAQTIAAAAEAHDREVRARVWEEADALLDAEGPGRVYHERLLLARAAEERGR